MCVSINNGADDCSALIYLKSGVHFHEVKVLLSVQYELHCAYGQENIISVFRRG